MADQPLSDAIAERADELARLAPPLNEEQKARLRALLKFPAPTSGVGCDTR